MEKRIYRINEVAELFGICKVSVYAWINSGKLPQPKRMGNRFTYFLKEDIDKLIKG